MKLDMLQKVNMGYFMKKDGKLIRIKDFQGMATSPKILIINNVILICFIKPSRLRYSLSETETVRI